MLPKRIVVIGSSSTEGKVDPEMGGFAGRLRAWHESKDQHNHVFNLGISGDTTSGMLARLLPESKPRKPDLILLQHGLNDTIRIGVTSAPNSTHLIKFKENIRAIIAQARTLCDIMVLSVYPNDDSKTTPIGWKNYFYHLTDAKIYAAEAKMICREEQVPYLDVFNQWLRVDYKKYLYSDGLHANALGHQKIFEALKDFLEKYYES